MKKRADIILYEKGLVDSREKGKRVIMEGSVFIGNQRIDKPGEKIDEDAEITIKENPNIYVSRGGLKLEKAVELFDLALENKVCMDIGSSTGGFTDCMLRKGASKSFAVDVGYGQLDWKLRNDPRVVVMERTNIRNVTKEDINEEIDFISIDVSFISLRLVLPVAKTLLSEDGQIIALIKPQFEAGKDKVGKKGIIRDKNIHFDVIKTVAEFSNEIGLGISGLTYSPITGATGNIEYLIYLKNNINDTIEEELIAKVIEEAHNTLS
ncbi:TlyA family RNA methyltransferase [Tissierella sp. MB52-C2]|uniref:TlyA family RNA methyltransferase n=1 Tax=Tissierella sp. MB52-C2 TaxID=3070999 RepID=UPI00280BD27C|nr:TlyA family RNA methyltransferase [Tissierella sp. MB52-C2]WMM26910.1 TlyA family RNA methyltransferase [Tissierella sp. MB52-C2]